MSEAATANGSTSPSEETSRDDTTQQKSLEMQEQSMGPLKEDLAEWIAKTLGIL